MSHADAGSHAVPATREHVEEMDGLVIVGWLSKDGAIEMDHGVCGHRQSVGGSCQGLVYRETLGIDHRVFSRPRALIDLGWMHFDGQLAPLEELPASR